MTMTPTQFRDWRLGQNFTQKRAAEALGLNHRTIALYEAGWRTGMRPVVIPRVVELACQWIAFWKAASAAPNEIIKPYPPNPQTTEEE